MTVDGERVFPEVSGCIDRPAVFNLRTGLRLSFNRILYNDWTKKTISERRFGNHGIGPEGRQWREFTSNICPKKTTRRRIYVRSLDSNSFGLTINV